MNVKPVPLLPAMGELKLSYTDQLVIYSSVKRVRSGVTSNMITTRYTN